MTNDPQKVMIPLEQWEAKQTLLQRHPHYAYMDHDCRWRRYRAILDGFESDEQKTRFLPRAIYEQEPNYEIRKKITHYMGVSETAIDQVKDAVFANEPRIEADGVESFLDDCDGAGTRFVEFMEPIAKEALGMGICFAVLDGPGDDPLPPGAAQQDAIKEGRNRAFASMVKAEEVVNWGLDRRGKPEWVIIRRIVYAQRGPEDPCRRVLEVSVYTKKDVSRWHVQISDDGKSIESDAKLAKVELPNPLHDLGEVPVYPCYGREIGPFKGESFVKGASRVDVAALNHESWYGVALYRHANPLLKFFSSNQQTTELILSGSIVRLDSGSNEDLKYESAPESAFAAREGAIRRFESRAVAMTGMNPTQTPDTGSTRGESGIAQRVRFTHTQKKVIDQHARSVARVMRKLLDGAEIYIKNVTTSSNKTVTLHATLEVEEPRDALRTAKEAGSTIRSETLAKELEKKAAVKMLPGANPETMKRIMDEIDADRPTQSNDSKSFGA